MTNTERIYELEYLCTSIAVNLGVLVDKHYGVSQVSDEDFIEGCIDMKEMLMELAERIDAASNRIHS